MIDRNVEALHDLLKESGSDIEGPYTDDHYPVASLANWLASRGVLATSTLRDEDMRTDFYPTPDGAAAMRHWMEGLATGEPE